MSYFYTYLGCTRIAYSFSYYNRYDTDPALVILGNLIKTKDNQQRDNYLLENKMIIAKNISEFFERILKANGKYYFDLPDFNL